MRAFLCWNCGRLCNCEKAFPNGRPKKKSECCEYMEAPPDTPRITHQEMADTLGCPISKIEQLVTSATGIRYLTNAFARKGITLTYEHTKKRIYFYKEENQDV